MNRTVVKASALTCLALAAATCLASPVAAQTPAPTPSVSVAPCDTSFFVYNFTKQTTDVYVFANIDAMFRRTLQPGETWQVTSRFGDTNEIGVRFPGDPNTQLLAHFACVNGNFRLTDVPHVRIAYQMQTSGKNRGIMLYPVPPGRD